MKFIYDRQMAKRIYLKPTNESNLNNSHLANRVVGVLIEVPVMLTVVRIVNASEPWYERRAAVVRANAAPAAPPR